MPRDFRPGEPNAARAYQAIRRMITAERAMRERVFYGKASLREQKVAECDRALAALEYLRLSYNIPTGEEEQPRQESLL